MMRPTTPPTTPPIIAPRLPSEEEEGVPLLEALLLFPGVGVVSELTVVVINSVVTSPLGRVEVVDVVVTGGGMTVHEE